MTQYPPITSYKIYKDYEIIATNLMINKSVSGLSENDEKIFKELAEMIIKYRQENNIK